ncbi:hypothetical protein [Enterococcus mundtii]|uniref:hypothetical protein n=1 Tax=Enterococcus mundtii TaxID=53346 RepID=UPI0008255473|nr:hypothetical protein [Enterococcus mundtii]
MLDEQKKHEFEKRVDMLALSLALKPNDKNFDQNDDYKLLISTYIKMLEQDQDDFFIDRNSKQNIIRSLERTKAYFDFTEENQLRASLEKLVNDDPTDFMLFPMVVPLSEDINVYQHLMGFVVYKKEHDFTVLTVDKMTKYYEDNIVYQIIPNQRIKELSTLLFEERYDFKLEKFYLLECLTKLSTHTEPIEEIVMNDQTVGNCVVASLDASLKVILSNCRESIFSVDREDLSISWNPNHNRSTLEMRKRFLSAVKGENPEWNQLFDYIFDFYLYRMGKLPENREDSPIKSKTWYKVIRNMFAMDYYIQEILANGGKIQPNHEPHPNSIYLIEPKGVLLKKEIQNVPSSRLDSQFGWIENQIKRFKERLLFIKIDRAKAITQHIICCLEEKKEEINQENERRRIITVPVIDEGKLKPSLNQLIQQTIPVSSNHSTDQSKKQGKNEREK